MNEKVLDVHSGTLYDEHIENLKKEVEYWRDERGEDIEFYVTPTIHIPDHAKFGRDKDRDIATFVASCDAVLWRRICTIVGIIK